jgi:L-amino acid ligase C-terminal domain 2
VVTRVNLRVRPNNGNATGDEGSQLLSRFSVALIIGHSQRKGTLRRVTGIDVARAMTDIEDVTISVPLGGTLVPVPGGNKYLGFIFAGGDTLEGVEAALRRAHSQLESRSNRLSPLLFPFKCRGRG